jgi:hypothetical protein
MKSRSTESGRFHEVGFYRSDDEFRALIVPFVEEGVAAGQPVIVGFDDRKANLLRSWLYNPAAVTFVTSNSLYATPATPALEVTDPSPAQGRRAVASIGHGQVSDTVLEELKIGVTEAIINARRHGRPAVTARIWAASGRILVHVHDTGPGPRDPLAGLVPAWARPEFPEAELRLIHMLDLDAALSRSRDGFTVRLATGPPDGVTPNRT